MALLSALGIDLSVIIAQLINYGILIVALTVLLYRPILKLLDERRERIRKSMEDAKRLEQQVKNMEKDHQKSMKELDTKASAILANAKKQAESVKTDLLAAAQKEVDALLERGRKQLEDEKRSLVSDLEKTVSQVAVKLAGKVLEREFSPGDQQRIVGSLKKDIPSLIR